MKPSFIHSLVNDRYEDPSLFVRILREKRAFLFDIGKIDRLNPGDLQKITDVFVTHTHIDHFIGFDTLLRALLRREIPLRVFGPSNITDCVEGKLRSYTWNLIKEYPLKIEVFAIDRDRMILSSFHAENCFKRIDNGISEFNGIILKEPPFTVKAIQLDHQVPCLAFSIEEEFHINVNKALLKEMGFPVGPWLSDLKRAIREDRPGDMELMVSGKRYILDELKKIVNITNGQKISYVTDVSISDENIRKIIEFVRNSDTFYCEAYFMDKDIDRALKRFHLTAKITGRIAREAGVKNLLVMHFSPKYRALNENPEQEAMEEFRQSTFLKQGRHSAHQTQMN
ncbi:MAG: ribonuclease Z [Nitrospirae bacterium]|jgi:ribonuclease Z|nr:ribonuclease Z [Nitrospirota bacterium]